MVVFLLACTPSPTPAVLPTPPAEGPVAPGWYALDPLPVPLQEVSVLEVGDAVWVLGGFDDTVSPVDTVWILDRDGWRAGPALPKPLHHLNAAVVDGRIHVLGALSGRGFTPIDRSWRFEDDGTWSTLPPVPEPLGAAAVGVVGSEVLLAGGVSTGTIAVGYAYDTAAGTWRALPDLPAPRDHGVGAGGDAFRVLGGRDGGIGNVRGDVFALVDGAWEAQAPLPTARAGTAGAQLPDGRVLVAGGEGNPDDPDGVFADVEIYDPAVDAWEVLESLPTPRHGTQAAWFDGGIVIPGGATVRAFHAVDTVEWLVLE
ncbi:MAG: kelch repeat-containing protein [Alphaproteobacteria bacterium]|nr:kelch repeat-containing protein [Alphaproteobacteria bacterium]